nr:hypothetical protein [uncultured Desulfobulbus sp.]
MQIPTIQVSGFLLGPQQWTRHRPGSAWPPSFTEKVEALTGKKEGGTTDDGGNSIVCTKKVVTRRQQRNEIDQHDPGRGYKQDEASRIFQHPLLASTDIDSCAWITT